MFLRISLPCEALGTPPYDRGYIANPPICGPVLGLSPTWGPPRWKVLCSQSAHLWAISDFVPHFEALGSP